MSLPDISINVDVVTNSGANSYTDLNQSVLITPIIDLTAPSIVQGYDILVKKPCKLQLTNSSYPVIISFLADANNTVLNNCSFNRDVMINPANISILGMNSCTFAIDNVESNSSNCKIIGTSPLTLNMSNTTFLYNGSVCLSTNQSVNVVNMGSNTVVISHLPSTGLSAISEPRSLLAVFNIHLPGPANYNFGNLSDNYNFVVDGSGVVISNTLFAAQCNFTQNNYPVTFTTCVFNINYDGSANSYECSTDGNITFLNNTILRPSSSLFNNNSVWQFRNPNSITTIPYVNSLIIELSSGIYQNFANINTQLQNNLTLRLLGGSPLSNYSYTLGTQASPILYPINMLLDVYSQANSFDVTYYSTSALGLNNQTAGAVVLTQAWVGVPAGLPFPYTLNNNDSSNNNITINGNFTNNGGNIIHKRFNLTLGSSPAPTFTYQNSSTQINVGLENTAILSLFKVLQTSGMSMLIPLGTQPTFDISGSSQFVGCDIRNPCTFNARNRVTFGNSNFQSNSYNFNLNGYNVDLYGCHVDVSANLPFILDNNSNLTIENCVIDMHGNKQLLSQGSTGLNPSLFTRNVVRLNSLPSNVLSLDNLFNTPLSNPFNVNNVVEFNQATAVLTYTTANLNRLFLAADPSLPLVNVSASDVNSANNLVVNGTVELTSNILAYTPATFDSFGNVSNTLINLTMTRPNPVNVIKFSGTQFSAGSSTPTSFLTSDPSGCPLVAFNNVKFVIEPANYTVSPLTKTNLSNFNVNQVTIIVNQGGNYLLDNDPLIQLDVNGNVSVVSDATGSYRNLSRTGLITINVPSYSGIVTSNVKVTCNGLTVNDDMSGNHTLNLSSNQSENSMVDISSNSANYDAVTFNATERSRGVLVLDKFTINASNNNTNAVTISSKSLNNAVTFGYNMQFNTGNMNSLVHILAEVNDASGALISNSRKLTINNSIIYTSMYNTKLKYFIWNEGSMVLDVGSAPNQANIRNQYVYWPGLLSMYNVPNVKQTIVPLTSNNSVVFAQSWDITTSVAITNYLGSNGNYGLTLTSIASTGPYVQYDNFSNITSLTYVQVVNAFYPTVSLALQKTYTNQSTSHTGKIATGANGSGPFVDTQSNLTLTNGWAPSVIDFSSGAGITNLTVMPKNTNNVSLSMNSGLVVYNNLYTITQDQIINDNSGAGDFSIDSYVNSKMVRISSGTSVDPATPINVTNNKATIQDINFDPSYNSPITTQYYYIFDYKVPAINGNNFSFLNNVTIDLSWNNPYFLLNDVSGNNGNTTSILIHGIDTQQPTSDTVTFTLGYTDNSWNLYDRTLYTRVNMSLYNQSNNNVNKQTLVTNFIPDYQLWVSNIDASWNLPIPHDASGNVPSTTKILSTSASFDISRNLYKQVDGSYNPVTGERVYEGYNYITVVIIQGNGTQPPTPANFNFNNTPLSIGSPDSNAPRGKVIYYLIDASGNVNNNYTNIIPKYNVLYRYKVVSDINNMMDQTATAANTITYNLNTNATGGSSTTAANITLTNVKIPLYIDIHANTLDRQWNSSVSYTTTITRATEFNMYAVFSGAIPNSGYNLLLKYSNDASNNSNIQSVLNNYMSKQYYQPNNNTIVFQSILNIPSQYVVGNFYINASVDPSSNFSYGSANIPYGQQNSRLWYNDAGLQQQVTMILGKALDQTSNLETTANNINLANVNNKVITITNADYNLQPLAFNKVITQSGSVFPYNKFTKFFLAFNTTTYGIYVDASGVVNMLTPASERLTLVFVDEDGNVVNDIQCQVDSSRNVPYQYDPADPSTYLYANAGKQMQYIFFSRVNNYNNALESSYSKLNVYAVFSNNSGSPSSFKNLNGNANSTLIATIDYSNVGLTSVNMSQVFLGNWRIMPSGDGTSLLFRYVQDGSNPYTVAMSLDGTQTRYDASNYVNNILPHFSVPLPQDGKTYPKTN